MAENSNISWTNHTQNFWVGCSRVSAGCDFCYADRDMSMHKMDFDVVRRTSEATFNRPLIWHKKLTGDEPLHERLVFTCSWSDFFHPDADAWRADAWAIIKATPHLTYQILTKRPNRVLRNLPDDWGPTGYENVWLGVTVEDQDAANRRIPLLRDWPAAVRFVSFEPLIGAIDLTQVANALTPGSQVGEAFDPGGYWQLPFEWAILGGESGNEKGEFGYRPADLFWFRLLADQLTEAHVAVWMKQLGTDLSNRLGMTRHGKVVSEWPVELQQQELPQIAPVL